VKIITGTWALWGAALVLAGPVTVGATNTVLVAPNAVWRYLDDGSNQGTAWRAPGFSDATWSNGTAQLGYGDGDESTVVGYGPNANNKYLTTYFRRTFSVSDPTLFRMLKLRLLRDDGAVVYLNGTQVRTDNMPSNTVTYTTRARVSLDTPYEDTFYESGVPTHALVSGDNVLAIEIHQVQTNSTDLSFAAELTGSTDALFVQRGAVWRYKDDGSDQGTAWRGTNFNDVGWTSGPAELGYGDGDEATVVGYGGNTTNKYITTYFRHSFYTTNVEALTSLHLRMLLDDGAVVYVNETAVLIHNLSGTINYLTQAGSAVGSADEVTWSESFVPPGTLVNGTNTIAVEVHQDATNSSDVSFDLELVGSYDVIPQSLIREPYLQAATTTGICVMVEADTPVPVAVEYGPTLAYGSSTTSTTFLVTTAGTFVHRVKLTGLQSDTPYHYRVTTTTTNTTDATFHTLGVPGADFRFAWMADCRAPGVTIHDQVSARIRTAAPLFSLYGGDLCDTKSAGLYSAFTNEFFRPNEMALITQVPFYNAVGNHETWGQNTKAFTEAPPSASGVQDFYSFDAGDLHVLVLNYVLGYAPGSAQYNFATNDLARSSNVWKIVTCHEPAYVFGGNHTPSANIKNLATNCFEKVGVDVMLSGHTHFFQHILTNRVHYFIIGSAGAELRMPTFDPSVVAAASNYNYAVADVTYTSLTINVYTETGAPLDSLTLAKSPRPASLAAQAQPDATHAGAIIAPAFQVAIRDLKNNVMATNSSISVSLGTNPAGGVLSGTLTVPAVNGVATFSNLSIDKMGAGYTLVASLGGLAVTSGVFNVLFADVNANDLADSWETDYLGGLSSGNATNDTDVDGASNLAEFVAGADPTNATDRFVLTIGTVNGEAVVSILARTAGTQDLVGYDRHFALDATTNLPGGWVAVPGYDDLIGIGQTVAYTNAAAGSRRFFRARAWLQNP
jgi:hypothetical protein